ncbi:MAG: LysR family transcriptional regulator, partial [Spongiibacteraceae bacterium]|nr:LysR family transcriptional regulator [Spongiibacteraceae bacterium]
MDKLKSMRYFCSIDQTGSFSGAARLAKVPVSTLSRSIQALESDLGAELLKRSTRHIALTEIGQIYLEQCKDILAAIDRAEGQVGSYQSTPSGVLRISALPLYAEMRLLPILEALQETYPDIVIDLDLSNQVSDLNRDGIDIAIRGGRVPNQRVIAQRIDDNTPLLCASKAYLTQYGTPRTVADLANHKALLYRAPAGVLYWQVEYKGVW